MNRRLHLFVKILIICGMVLGLGLVVYVSGWVLPQYPELSVFNNKAAWRYPVSYALMLVCFFGMEYIAWTLFGMMRTVDGDPFVERNVKALRNMGISALIVTAAALLTPVFITVPLAVLAALPIGMCGLFSLVLSGIFKKAVAFKEENDLTV